MAWIKWLEKPYEIEILYIGKLYLDIFITLIKILGKENSIFIAHQWFFFFFFCLKRCTPLLKMVMVHFFPGVRKIQIGCGWRLNY